MLSKLVPLLTSPFEGSYEGPEVLKHFFLRLAPPLPPPAPRNSAPCCRQLRLFIEYLLAELCVCRCCWFDLYSFRIPQFCGTKYDKPDFSPGAKLKLVRLNCG